jgi:tetratricopeptide (TPR) repeat protein
MFKYHYLVTSIFGAVTTLVLQGEICLAALSSKEIGQLAQKITVRIATPGSLGSGIIFARNGNTYQVLTARHVVDSINAGEESDVETFDGQAHYIDTQNIKTFGDNWDLAVVEFSTNKDYQVAKLGDSSNLALGENVYVAGFPIPTQAMNVVTLNFTEGKLTAVSSRPFEAGYALAYNNNTLPGMSGGAVLDEQGKVVGVHGRADVLEIKETADPSIRIKSGHNLGIPINYYLGLSQQIAFDPHALMKKEPSSADDYYLQAAQQSQQNNHDEAISLYNRALELNPNYTDAYNNRGLAYFMTRRYNEAITDYNKAIALNPLYGAAFNNRGTAYYLLKKPHEARADHDLASLLSVNVGVTPVIFPGMVSYLRNQPARGEVFRSFGRGGNVLDAYPHLKRQVELIGDNDGVPLEQSEAYAHYNRAIAYLNLGRYAEARQNLQQSVQLYNQRGSRQIAERILNFLSQIPPN